MLMKEVCEVLNMSRDTIRYYENLGLIQPLKINNVRHFSDGDIERLQQIKILKHAQFKLNEILAFVKFDEKFSDMDDILNMDEHDFLILKTLITNKLDEICLIKRDIEIAEKILTGMKEKLKEINHDDHC